MNLALLWLGGILLSTVPYLWAYALCRVARDGRPASSFNREPPRHTGGP